jgi:hypothetical protein
MIALLNSKRPASFRIPLSAFIDLPIMAKPGAAFRMECACGSVSWSPRCHRCNKKESRARFLAKWDCRYSREEILDAILAELGWTNRNYDFSDERQAFLAALEANAEPETFRQILAEGGLDGIIEERDEARQERTQAGAKAHAAKLKARWDADSVPVPALVLTPAEAKIHATELLRRPRFWADWHMQTGSRWGYQDEIYLQVLCIAGSDLKRAAEVLGRSPSSIAWRASDAGMMLPPAWRRVIASKAPRKPANPRWVPMAYPLRSEGRRGNAELMEVNRLVADYLPGRADICQEIMLALWEKKVTMEDLRKQGASLRSFVRQFYRSNYEGSGYAKSLDASLTPNGAFSIMDTLSTEDGMWH